MSSPWHAEVYTRALNQMARNAEGKRKAGWLEWFQKTYPAQHAKMQAAMDRANELFGKSDSASMEAFKQAVKVEVDATKWAIDKYNEEVRAA